MNDALRWRDLHELRLDGLEECYSAWQRVAEVAGEGGDLAKDSIDQMDTGLGGTDENAMYSVGREAALERGDTIRRRLSDGHDEAVAVGAVLSEAAEQLNEIRKRFRDQVADIEEDGSAAAQGGGKFDVDLDNQVVRTPSPPPEFTQHLEVVEQWNQGYQEEADAYRKVLNDIVGEAVAVDYDTCDWLERNSILYDGFNAKAVAEVPSVKEAHDDAEEAADLIEAALEDGELSDEEIDQINELLRNNSENEFFTTHLLERLGPEDFLRLAGLNQIAEGEENPNGTTSSDVLLGYLSDTLGTATNSDNIAHIDDEWMAELHAAGASDISIGDENDGDSGRTVKGYTALAPLLEQGEYHSDFLVPVAEHMLALENEGELSVGAMGYEYGSDKTNAFDSALIALGNNPDAALDFFQSDPYNASYPGGAGADVGTVEDPLNYLLESYDYSPNNNEYSLVSLPEVPGIDPSLVGDAIEAATIGLPAGTDPGTDGYPPASEEMARLTEDLVGHVAADPERFMDGQLSGTVGNLGAITAAYGEDFYAAFLLDTEEAMLPESNGTALNLDTYNNMPGADLSSTEEWMKVLGHHEGGMGPALGAITSHAEQAMLNEIAAPGEEADMSDATTAYGRVLGTMLEGQNEAIANEAISGYEHDQGKKDAIGLVSKKFPGADAVSYMIMNQIWDPSVENLNNEISDIQNKALLEQSEELDEQLEAWLEEMSRTTGEDVTGKHKELRNKLFGGMNETT